MTGFAELLSAASDIISGPVLTATTGETLLATPKLFLYFRL